MHPALIVFAKAPIAGHVKTRLTGALRDEEAAKLYRAFLYDALDQYATLGIDVRLYVDPRGAYDFDAADPSDARDFDSTDPCSAHSDARDFDDFLSKRSIKKYAQGGAGLGERMARAFEETFGAGYDRVAIVGTDHPTLPSPFIRYAFKSISGPKSIAIGPAEDGGYYLLAMNDFVPEVFREMSYSHVDVFDETLYRVAAAGAAAIVLPEWYDVDTPEELRRLRADLVESDAVVPRTRRQLERLAQRHDWLVR